MDPVGRASDIASLIPAVPPPPPVRYGEELQVDEVSDWNPVLRGFEPPGWRVATDPVREVRHVTRNVEILAPVYRIIPAEGSVYLIEPGTEGGANIPDLLDATINQLDRSAMVLSATREGIQKLVDNVAPASGKIAGQSEDLDSPDDWGTAIGLESMKELGAAEAATIGTSDAGSIVEVALPNE